MHLFIRVFATVAIVAASAHAQAPMQFVGATERTIRFGVDSVTGAATIRQVWVQNNSSVPIKIVKITLYDCQNLDSCGDYPSKAKVAPGAREVVLTLRPKVRNQRLYFSRYQLTWREDSTSVIFQRVMREAGLLAATPQADPAQTEHDRLAQAPRNNAPVPIRPSEETMRIANQRDAEMRAAAVANGAVVAARPPNDTEAVLSPDNITSLGDNVAAWRAEPDTISIKMGEVLMLSQLRIIAVDASGKSLGRFRGRYRFGLTDDGLSLAPPDTIIPSRVGRSTIVVGPTDVLNSGRSKPFTQLKFTIVVR